MQMTRTLLTAIFLTLFSQPAWAEKLNAELLCESYWNVDFRSVDGEDAFAAIMLLEVLKEQMTAERRQFSQRISIKDSVLDEQISLKVTDTLIEADKRAIPTEILSDLPFVVSSACLVQTCASFPKQLWSEVLLMYEASFWVSCGYLM